MRNLPTIARRELGAYFLSPIAYVVLTLFLLVQGYSFWIFTAFLSQPSAPHGAVLQYFLGGTFLYWMVLIFVVPAITMRLIADERRSGTIETLMTAPVTEREVVIGKFLGAWLFYAFLWLPTVGYVWLISQYSPSGAGPDVGPVASAYLGTLLIGAMFIAVGLFASTLTRNQILAAVLGCVFLSLLLLVGIVDLFVQTPLWKSVIKHVNLFEHMETFARGIVDTRHLTYYGSVIVLSLFASIRMLETQKGQ